MILFQTLIKHSRYNSMNWPSNKLIVIFPSKNNIYPLPSTLSSLESLSFSTKRNNYFFRQKYHNTL